MYVLNDAKVYPSLQFDYNMNHFLSAFLRLGTARIATLTFIPAFLQTIADVRYLMT